MKLAGRQPGVYCLNRGWRFMEKDESVLPEGRTHEEVYGFAKGGAARGPAGAGFDDRTWEIVDLPHDWVTKKNFDEKASPNQGYKERGTGWYRMSFGLETEDRKKQILLEFEGMSCDAQVYVNGAVLKRSFSGYNSFTVDMTDMANFGVVPNVIAVHIDANAWEGWWYEGAGIYRNVWLVKKAPVHIAADGVFAKPVLKSREENIWSLQIEAEIENSFEWNRIISVRAELLAQDGSCLAVSDVCVGVSGYGNQTVTMKLDDLKPHVWSPEDPYCYQVRTTVYEAGEVLDYLVQTTGFRSIRLDAATGFWLNGRQVKLKGFCNHQDHAGVGVAVPYSIKEYRVRKLKELGANAYRCAHNPDPEMLEICDKEGLMVMEENRGFSSAADNLEDIKGIVKRARNHPSVILYSAFNEEPLQGTGKGRRMAGRIQAAIKSMDDTRPVLGALNGGYMEEGGAVTILEATGINYNPARYDEFHKKFPQIPLIGSETASAFMVRGEYETDRERHLIAGYDDHCAPWGNTVREAWQYVIERPFVAGTFVWTGFDYRGEPTPFEWPSVATFFGTYDSCGFEKDACYFYKAFWKPEPMVHIVSPWSRSGLGDTVKVMIISNCDEVILQVGDKILLQNGIDALHPVMLEVAYEALPLKAVGLQDHKEAACDIQRPIGEKRYLRLEASQSVLHTGGHEAAAVNVYLEDENGTVIENGDVLIHFAVENGSILGVGNGDPNSHEPDVASYRRTFHGKAQAIIKPAGEETVLVRVSGEDAEEASIELSVVKAETIPYMMPMQGQVVEELRIFHKLFAEKPEPVVSLRSNDMNSFESVGYSETGQAELEGRYGSYALYMAHFSTGKAAEGRYLYFENVLGHVWIYLNGRELYARTDSFGGMVAVTLPQETEGEQILSVVIKNDNEEWPHAGLVSPSVLRRACQDA